MPSRRDVLLSSGCVSLSALSGCLDILGAKASVREVGVIIYNRDSRSRTFNVALEIEEGVLDWQSQTVEADTEEVVFIDPPEGAYPVAFHGEVGEYQETFEFDDLGSPDDRFCLYLYFYYQHFFWDNRISRAPQLECE
ncbi:hypothetical protein [Halosolutus halophilus]|uniref:hypothetical protein n=1 Tax=Halosolutus halophilus TaxID=1552990 RepID=UPI002234F84D|nr:hypothetical protein [Halosolutus halophilus]